MRRCFVHLASGMFALASAAASAVALNPRGIGQVLLYSYYTVNRGQDTLVSLVNTDDAAKLVRVRFLEGYNGRIAFATYVFLSAHDVWTAAITQTADDGGAKLVTSDTSCTYPALTPGGDAFVTTDFDGDNADSGPTSIMRTREGSIEIIEAADIAPGSATEAKITHANGAPPCDFAESPAPIDMDDLVAPTGGLYGSASIVDVLQGTFFAYEPTALANFTDQVAVAELESLDAPSLDDAHSDESNATARAYLVTSSGVPLVLDYERGVDAVSAVLMASSIANEYLLETSLGANTDWVVTFPTKRYYVDADRVHGAPFLPFVTAFSAGTSPLVFGGSIFDREELESGPYAVPGGCGFPCPAEDPLMFSWEVNVLGFLADGTPAQSPSGVLGSRLSVFWRTGIAQPPRPNAGWLTIDLVSGDGGSHQLPGGVTPHFDDTTLDGLPVTGFMVYNIVNANAQPGVLGNYGGAFAYRSTEHCYSADAACTN
jgi:hypothetical protein